MMFWSHPSITLENYEASSYFPESVTKDLEDVIDSRSTGNAPIPRWLEGLQKPYPSMLREEVRSDSSDTEWMSDEEWIKLAHNSFKHWSEENPY